MDKYVVAVSGGVDSVVLLDMLVRGKSTLLQNISSPSRQLIVAHVDHGIRGDDSAADARFVRSLAAKYALRFVQTSLNLGSKSSEEMARARRYEFLFREAGAHQAQIVTAHHADDVVETIAINLLRGTGWRGVGVLGREGVKRPLLGYRKHELYEYALEHRLEWVEDATNATSTYLRNRVRRRTITLSDHAVRRLVSLRHDQVRLARTISEEVDAIITTYSVDRHFLTYCGDEVATELLGSIIGRRAGVRPMQAQVERALLAVKVARPGTICQVGDNVSLYFTSRSFEVRMV